MFKRKYAVLLLLVVAMLLSSMLPVLANTVDEKQDELEGVQENIDQRQEELQQNKQEQNKVKQEIELIQREVEVIEAELRAIGTKIRRTEEEITAVEAHLAEAEEKLAEIDEVLAVRLRALHEHGQVSYLEVLFSSTSFADFLTRYNDLRQLIDQDKQLLEEAMAERDRVAELKESLEKRRQELLTLRRNNINKKQEQEVKQARQKLLVSDLQAAYNKTNNEIRKLEAEAQKIENLILQMQAQQNGSANQGTGTLGWPVQGYGRGWITSGYGYRRDPISGKQGSFHGGIDIGIPRNRWPGAGNYNGNPVNLLAADAGVAHTYRMGSGYGNLVIVDHGKGVATVYGHTHDFLVANGQAVYKGQAVAIVGSTGYSTGPHVHFEVRINGERVNPLNYVH
ncbi:MAG TPA: peptidoglycan DD-metalloendopeptidase family protein [Oscillospiraceae bacterium]|nr:peptidoglycan DD-metalloendopeptidase family protein [Oscillospiraceae bacterium]